ncbi:hypothetical protein LTR10_009518 [Elasticomyces elasticus]|nr:hypothetical protein LTR10_009518 [Elasticomyces elasticus]KAK4971386.1 hypothetical protein LTR42_007113 [Elasticomyces elasticus]
MDVFFVQLSMVSPPAFAMQPRLAVDVLSAFLALAAGSYVLRALRSLIKTREFHSFATIRKCRNPRRLNPGFTVGVVHKFNLLFERYGDLFDDYFANKFRDNGATHAIVNAFGIPRVVHTIEPANLRHVLTTSARDWGVFSGQRNSLYPLAQNGVLTTSGLQWAHNRKPLSRHVNGVRSKDPSVVESDISALFEAIGSSDDEGWTSASDMSDLLRRMALDMATTFFFGVTAQSQLSGVRRRTGNTSLNNNPDTRLGKSMALTEDFTNAWKQVTDFVTWRAALGSKYWMADGPQYRAACAKMEEFADRLIDDVAAQAAVSTDSNATVCLVSKLLDDFRDRTAVRHNVLELCIAGQNMSGTALQWAFAELGNNPAVFAGLRSEILATFGTEGAVDARPMTWEHLRTCHLLQGIIAETLRLHPVVPTIARTALCDTVLPKGGGRDGQSPIAVPKGATFNSNLYLMHRRAEEWGDDAWVWKPTRWIGRTVGPEYAPFSSGPRNCMGRYFLSRSTN